jgi:hypothetical protein
VPRCTGRSTPGSRRILPQLFKFRAWPGSFFSASQNGVLVYPSGVAGSGIQLTWFDRTGKKLDTAGVPGDLEKFALHPTAAPWWWRAGTRSRNNSISGFGTWPAVQNRALLSREAVAFQRGRRMAHASHLRGRGTARSSCIKKRPTVHRRRRYWKPRLKIRKISRAMAVTCWRLRGPVTPEPATICGCSLCSETESRSLTCKPNSTNGAPDYPRTAAGWRINRTNQNATRSTWSASLSRAESGKFRPTVAANHMEPGRARIVLLQRGRENHGGGDQAWRAVPGRSPDLRQPEIQQLHAGLSH